MNAVAILLCPVLLLGPGLRQQQSLGSNDTFAAAGLTSTEVQEIVAGLERSAYDAPESWSAELRAKRVDLGGSRGIILQATKLLCGGTGNCQLFVFRQERGHWRSLFENEQAPIAESFQFGPAIAHGIKDLTVVTRMSAVDGQRVTYTFDGSVYRAKPARSLKEP